MMQSKFYLNENNKRFWLQFFVDVSHSLCLMMTVACGYILVLVLEKNIIDFVGEWRARSSSNQAIGSWIQGPTNRCVDVSLGKIYK